MPQRLSDIQGKLAYLLGRHESLDKALTDAQHNNGDIAHLGIQVGEIVGGCRECLDYCVKDVIDVLAPGYLSANTKERVYFPFSRKALNESRTAFHAIRNSAPSAYDALLTLVGKIEDRAAMDGVGPHYGYGLLKDINELVNDKKHDRISRATSVPDAKTLVEHPSGFKTTVAMYDLSDGKSKLLPPPGMLIQQEASQRLVKEFFVGEHEARALCRSAIKATAVAITAVYESVLGLPDGEVDPWELRKEIEVRLGEKALKRFSPILYRPILIGANLREKKQFHVKYEFDGDVKESSDQFVAVGRFLLEIFRSRVAAMTADKFRRFIRDNWRKVADQTPTTISVFEIVIDLPDVHCLELADGTYFEFDRIIFGIQYKFRTTSSIKQVSYLPDDLSQWMEVIKNLFDSSKPSKVLIGNCVNDRLQIQCSIK